ncbi:hypothetical protein DFN09_002516 [Clostridium acetobutylicum]|nr:hypothetical protein [Clostridium acetobutylicum]
MMEEKSFLPLGSIVILKGAIKKIDDCQQSKCSQ